MSKLGFGPVGMTVEISPDGRHLDEAAALEELGYSAIWLRGGQLDKLSRIAEVAGATTAVPVVPGIIPVDVYAPGEVTRLYAELQASAPGRFVAGLGGPQVPRCCRAPAQLRRMRRGLPRTAPGSPAEPRVTGHLQARSGVQRPVGRVPIVMGLVLAQDPSTFLIPDEGAVEKLAPASPGPHVTM